MLKIAAVGRGAVRGREDIGDRIENSRREAGGPE